jgi:hypothetical protein
MLISWMVVRTESYFNARVAELRSLATRGDPWVFLCASSFLEYLAKMESGKSTGAQGYKDFLRDYLFKVCPEYGKFRYRSGKADLADQMYHLLRCGIVHSFSVIADQAAKVRGGRDRSILLAHRSSGRTHLSNYVNNRRRPKLDSAVFIAEDFVEDIAKLTTYIFAESRKKTTSGTRLRTNIRKWVKDYPPIGLLFIPD